MSSDLSASLLAKSPNQSASKVSDHQPSPVDESNPEIPVVHINLPPSVDPAAIPASPPPQPRRSTRACQAPDRYGHWSKSTQTDQNVDTPKTWKQLLKSPNKHHWLKAADDKFASLLGMQTWKLVPRPEKRKIIKSKSVLITQFKNLKLA